MTWWLLFIALSALSIAGVLLFVPAEHRRNYDQCRKDGSFWSAAILSHSIWIAAAIQSVAAPDSVPAAIRITGAAVLAGGSVLQIWARRVNYLFIPALIYVPAHLREKGGPYAFCRHPGYFGFIFEATGCCLLLGQMWALFPMAAYMLLIVRRMIVEDRILSGKISL